VLDEDGERLIALAGPLGASTAQTYSMLADADVDFPEVALSDGSTVVASHAAYAHGLHTLREQSDRKAVFAAHYSVYDSRPNTYAAILTDAPGDRWWRKPGVIDDARRTSTRTISWSRSSSG
jgi:oligoendopeptidase F